ncbi:unnamed protein product [Lymnaea stagnalis]|uniref:Uncharacterized protein n=1 Tax=Lymnaea stagnalis TaxID=6523 RepID=A0AAV2HW81_LYMST
MKETTYGWYPSVHDIYRPKGRPSSYHLDCLYQYENSMYYQDKAAPPKPELMVRGVSSRSSSPTPQDLKRRAKSVPVPKFNPTPKLHIPTPAECWSTHKSPHETQWAVAGDNLSFSPAPPSEVTWPLAQDKQQQLLKQQQDKYCYEKQQSSQQAWDSRRSFDAPHSQPSAALGWPPAYKAGPVQPFSSYFSQNGQVKPRPPSSLAKSPGLSLHTAPTPPACGKYSSASKRPSRIQSATVRREKTPLPPRPVTAGPGRQTAGDPGQGHTALKPLSLPQTLDDPNVDIRPETQPPAPYVYDVNVICSDDNQDSQVLPRPVSPEEDDYETIVEKYGWRAQVHGDPYGLKQPMKRISYAVNCPEPVLLPEPPNVHMETNEPFFYNTIPKRPLSFAVNKEWMSEVLLAKRLELQKRDGGIKYNYKKFAFVY